MYSSSSHQSLKIKAAAIIAIAILFSITVIWFGNVMLSRINNIEQVWHNYNAHAVTVNASLAKIRTAFGYGGFIHNYKNLVLRRDLSLVPKIEANLRATYEAIDALSEVEKSPEQQQYIKQLRQVIDSYAENLSLAQKLVTKRLSPLEIDARVKVDDKTALDDVGEYQHGFGLFQKLGTAGHFRVEFCDGTIDLDVNFLGTGSSGGINQRDGGEERK